MRQPFRKASVYIALLLILEAVTGLVIVIVTAIYQALLSGYLADTECRLLYGYLFNIYIFGCQLIVCFLCSITMWNRLWCRRCTPNIRLLLTIWLFYSCIIIASGFAMVCNLFHSGDVLELAAENSLIRGIDMYYSCPEWKLLWDGLQLRKECCGVHSYTDWMNADWMPRSEDNCTSDGRVLTPFTCCKRDCPSCYANYGPDNNNAQPFPPLSIDSINTNGCLAVFSESVWRYIYILLGLCILAMKFLILLCCLTKYILSRQNMGDGCDTVGLTDDEGRPLVVVKYPCNVRCITIGEDDLASDMAPEPNYCNCGDVADDPCQNCYEN